MFNMCIHADTSPTMPTNSRTAVDSNCRTWTKGTGKLPPRDFSMIDLVCNRPSRHDLLFKTPTLTNNRETYLNSIPALLEVQFVLTLLSVYLHASYVLW